MRLWRRLIIPLMLILIALIPFSAVSAHANLERADPEQNTVLTEPPPVIRLWFTEPIEPNFSYINLRDVDGNIVQTPPSQIDPADSKVMFLTPGTIPDGLYTVSWRAVSNTDGHQTIGSFPIAVGEGIQLPTSFTASYESIPADSAFIRWLNLLSMSLAVGGIGFMLFVWQSSVPEGQTDAERRIRLLMWAGWLVLGIAGGLALLLQVSLAADVPLLSAIGDPALGRIVAGTRYGNLWLTRTALWFGLALALVFARGDRWFYSVGLGLGFGILLTNSLFSHAAGAQDNTPAIAADWLHLIASSLWIGGLVQFIAVIGAVRRYVSPPTPMVSTLVGYFSNFARVTVAILVITGLYATWLQVGSIDGLLTTLYGQALLVKLILFLPLLGIAGINLWITHRELKSGNQAWIQRLRGMLGAEIVLTIAILGAVGAMTAISPSRSTLAVRASVPPPPLPSPIIDTKTVDDLNINLEITPGWIGNNTFNLTLTDVTGQPVTDASRIRLRLNSLSQNIGESELRPEHVADGLYSISGDNLSLTGEWRLRLTIQRPDKFDTVVDFHPQMSLPPAPAKITLVDPNPPLSSRVIALMLVGVLALTAGGFFIGQNRPRFLNGAGLLAAGLILMGLIFLGSGIMGMQTPSVAASEFEASVQTAQPSGQ
jgi:copper transport protein